MEGNGKAPPKRSTRSIDFFRGFLRSPEQVGSIIPSSRFLERRIINTSGVASARTVVELGPGTGGTTRAILAAMPEDARLLTIELDPQFSSILEAIGDPRLIPHTGSAADLADILAEHGLGAPDVVISGIPFSTMPREIGLAIIAAVRDNLAPGGRFVAYQFRGAVGRMGKEVMGEPEVEMEILNIPPMRFYTWQVDGASSEAEHRTGD
ncbi:MULTISPECIES: class I SAM-dependent methyltransferase [unclassified Wenzhouxiangella]|uniref:class I SAM-dependent methyltransferase n=1 Tax=unclassified Wenzhouxiangella TaxID=2613841 RepID=UPI000E32B11C|nr:MULTISPECIES: methyltransferase type 12 [unclassified Wenzhouxiangella]RFF27750.1 methyltransferase type 12 [Wenzhouxiangella sp. 15181]RFP68379.1 methyltransferase type 12 [Wenzhouxiangella sp. 15190]